MEYDKNFYEFLNGDFQTKNYKINYLSGPKIIHLGQPFEFPYEYNGSSVKLSRWQYMCELINHFETKFNLGIFFHTYFIKNIVSYNTKLEQKKFLEDLNNKLASYDQEIFIKDGKIKIKNDIQIKIILSDDIDFKNSKEKIIDMGGFAQILTTKEPDVLKKKMIITEKTSENDKKRFISEYKIMKLYENEKYILPVLELNESEPSFTMKRAKVFEDLKKTMDDSEFILYSIQLLESLQYIFNKKIFHRDLSLSNVLKWKNRWVLADFGISKNFLFSKTSTGRVMGKDEYIYPEILKNPDLFKNYKQKYDLFSCLRIVKSDIVPLIQNFNLKKEFLNIFENFDINVNEISPIIKQLKEFWINT